jgi:hypothetical protein
LNLFSLLITAASPVPGPAGTGGALVDRPSVVQSRLTLDEAASGDG